MKFVQDRPDENYHTDDAAEIYFRRSSNEAPTHLHCVGMGYTLSAHSNIEYDIELAPFELVGVGRFGAGRPFEGLSSTKWTGDSYKYGIYKHRRSLLIIESHGGGERGYLDPHSHALELFEQLCNSFSREGLWDICFLIARTQKQAYLKGRDEMKQLFLEGRLKHKRRNGVVVWRYFRRRSQSSCIAAGSTSPT